MASISNLVLTIDKDVANADVKVEYDIVWSSFDQLTNLQYLDTFRLIEDDTNQDGDDTPAGDDSISVGLVPFLLVSSNGNATTHRTKTVTMAFSNLNKDNTAGNTDDEIRAVVTLTPQLPVATSRESGVVTVAA
jgi:hypothetical protein